MPILSAEKPALACREGGIFLSRKISKLQKFKISLGVGLLLAILLNCWFSSFATVCAQVRADTLRLHVLANSDSEADQRLKLLVRDAILEEMGPLFSTAGSKQEAQLQAEGSLEQIGEIARRVLRSAGVDYPVQVRCENLYFPTTRYPDTGLTLPAGRYDAVRVELGQAQGKNWFCVLFPQLCVPACAAEEEEKAAYDEAEEQVTGGGYELRFALVEWVEQLREQLNKGAGS